MKFSDLKPGDHFTLPIDADGYEPDWWMLPDGSLYGGNCRGKHRTTARAENLAPDTPVAVIGHVTLHDRPTDIERAALTMAANHYPVHPALAAWKAALTSDPNEFRSLDEFAWSNADEPLGEDQSLTVRDVCHAAGYAFPSQQYDQNVFLFSLISDRKPAGQYTRNNDPTNDEYRGSGGAFDRPLAHILAAVAEYREMGRPDGDQIHSIMGMGSPLMNVTTSLAAAAVEYHHSIVALTERSNE